MGLGLEGEGFWVEGLGVGLGSVAWASPVGKYRTSDLQKVLVERGELIVQVLAPVALPGEHLVMLVVSAVLRTRGVRIGEVDIHVAFDGAEASGGGVTHVQVERDVALVALAPDKLRRDLQGLAAFLQDMLLCRGGRQPEDSSALQRAPRALVEADSLPAQTMQKHNSLVVKVFPPRRVLLAAVAEPLVGAHDEAARPL